MKVHLYSGRPHFSACGYELSAVPHTLLTREAWATAPRVAQCENCRYSTRAGAKLCATAEQIVAVECALIGIARVFK